MKQDDQVYKNHTDGKHNPKMQGKKTCLCQFKACLSGSSLPYSLYNGHLRRKIICNRDYLLCKTNPSSDNCRAKSKAFWENCR